MEPLLELSFSTTQTKWTGAQRRGDSAWEIDSCLQEDRLLGGAKTSHDCSCLYTQICPPPCLSYCFPLSLLLSSSQTYTAFWPFKNLALSFLILKLLIHLRKQMLQKQAASESSLESHPVCVIIAQGQFGTS